MTSPTTACPDAVAVASLTTALEDSAFDAFVVITPSFRSIEHKGLCNFVAETESIDGRIGKQPVLLVTENVPGKRLLLVPTGPLNRDIDDVRRYADAAKKAIEQVKLAGAVNPVFYLPGVPSAVTYDNALEVAFLGACQALWQPLEAREFYAPKSLTPVASIGLIGTVNTAYLNALAQGQYAARDLCGTEPERLAPLKFAEYCSELFKDSAVKMDVISERSMIADKYPLLDAVARASYSVERHRPCVIRLTYEPEGSIDKTVLLVGKGLVYDTGGADLKVGGAMAGMSRDKGGAASVAGLMKAFADYRPKGIKVVAVLSVVRNSIGSDCFVPDEILKSREGVRVRVGNTDAEGRLAMGDVLSEMKDLAKGEANPEIYTVATLTGHAARAMGNYTALVENGPARQQGLSQRIAATGDQWGDCSEVSRVRREDFDFVKPRSLADDVLSSNNSPSSVTARGHQFPMAFLTVASGLEHHGLNSEQPIPYVHVDIAGSCTENGDWQHGKPTGAAIASLFALYCRSQSSVN